MHRTLGAAEEAKDSSYDVIQDAVDRVPTGDWNAILRPMDKATRHILGKFALSTKRKWRLIENMNHDFSKA